MMAGHDGSDVDPRAVSAAFGRRLRRLRAERGFSKDELARRTGIHSTAIRRYERGDREPRIASVLALARGLGVKPGELLDGLEGEAEEGA